MKFYLSDDTAGFPWSVPNESRMRKKGLPWMTCSSGFLRMLPGLQMIITNQWKLET